MKRFCMSLIVGIFFVIATLGSAHASDKVYTLKIADSFPVKHPVNKIITFFMEEAKKQSNGKLEFNYYPAQQLGKQTDLLKLCQKGLVDVVYVGPSFFPGQFGLNTVTVLPFYSSAAEGTKIYNELYKNSAEIRKEWESNGVTPLLMMTASQYNVGTNDKKVTQPSDMKGLRLKTAGEIFDSIVKRYGAEPISMSFTDTYEAIQRKIVDGAIQALASAKGYRLYEVEKYHTYGLRFGGYPAAYAMNMKAFNKLPEDIQNVLFKAGDETEEFGAKLWDNMDASLIKVFQEKGMEIYQVPPDKKTEWFAPLSGIEEEWIASLEKRGQVAARPVFEQFKKICEEIAE